MTASEKGCDVPNQFFYVSVCFIKLVVTTGLKALEALLFKISGIEQMVTRALF